MTVETQETFICFDCEQEMSIEYESDYMCSICSDCFENYEECADCGEYFHKDSEILLVDTDVESNVYLCKFCIDNYYSCAECGAFTLDAIQVFGDSYCEECFNQLYTQCDECGATIDRRDAFRDDEDVLCEECFDDRESSTDGIHEYGYKPRPYFFGEAPYFGIELEVEAGMNFLESKDMVLETGGERLYLKEDASLSSNGFEIVTHPCSLDYHKKEFPWEEILKNLRSDGVKSHNAGNCGLHVHMNKDDLSKVEKIKIAALVHSQWKLFKHISRRNSHYGEFKNKKRALTETKSYQDGIGACSRDNAVFFNPPHTIEFRMFKGTLKYETFMARIECCHAIKSFIKESNIGLNKIYSDEAFTKGMFLYHIENNKKKYENLYKFLYDRNYYSDGQEVESEEINEQESNDEQREQSNEQQLDVVTVNEAARHNLATDGQALLICPICEEIRWFSHPSNGMRVTDTNLECCNCFNTFQPHFTSVDGVVRVSTFVRNYLIQHGFAHSMMCDCVAGGHTRFSYDNEMETVRCENCNAIYHPVFDNE